MESLLMIMNKLLQSKTGWKFKQTAFTLLLIMLFGSVAAQQQVLLFADSFIVGSPSITFDQGGIGLNTGNNDWVINNEYNGQGVYPNTPSEDSVLGGLGQIRGAPYSNYLHIHDLTLPGGAANANWDPSNRSDRFCYLSNAYCTLGLVNVALTFFWTGQGDSTAYGQVYFRTNFGPWLQTGQPKYYNQKYWKYESIQDSRFNGQQNLQFGFRWINAGSDTTKDVSLGIDDIIAVGQFSRDSFTTGGNFSILSVTPSPVCQRDTITITFKLDPPLCDGSYIVHMSDSTGNFAHDSTLQYVYNLGPYGATYTIREPVPANVHGNCFRLYIQRVGPPPLVNSDTSLCFEIQHCPVNITTNNAPVMNDADTTCVKSAIDVFFNSTGNFNTNNIYYAQLSDSLGDFSHADTIGKLVSNLAYPGMPGQVSGLIPASVPPGCGYYIRIVSSSPVSYGTTIGPFCLTQCDVTTNNTIDLHACINYPYATDTLTLNNTNKHWKQVASYDTCKNWSVELLDMMSFAVIDSGSLGVYHNDSSGTFTMIIGPQAQLPPAIQPGTYYMRILSNCSNEPWNETGTVIRLTIGAPSANLSIFSFSSDSVYCNSTDMTLYPWPINSKSSYNWTSNYFFPITTPGSNPYIGVNLNGAQARDWVVYVQENSFGCLGPQATYNFVTTTVPIVNISGPKKVCLGDTAIFNATYLPATYYNWTAPPGVRIGIQSNTQISMIFDSIGTFTISELSVNDCGSQSGTLTITVTSLFSVNSGADQKICIGDSVTLTGVVDPFPKTLISLDSSAAGNQGGMFNIIAHSDLTIDSFAVTFKSRVNNTITKIYTKAGTYKGYQQSAIDWNLLATTTIPTPSPLLNKTVIPYELNKTMHTGDTAAFYITTTNAPAVYEAYGNGIGIQQEVVFKSDGIMDFVQGCVLAYPFGAYVGPKVLDVTVYYRTNGGLRYVWSNGDSTAATTFAPTQSQDYHIHVTDNSGCSSEDSVYVTVDTLPRVYAGPDTIICPYGSYVMPATASPSASLSWQPVDGLNKPDSVNPVLNINQSSIYVLTATNPDGCKSADSVLIEVHPLSVNAGPDTSLCVEETYVMQGTASTDSFEWFPATGLSSATILTPVFNYDQTTQYYLQVSDTNGCVLIDTVVISVNYCNSYIKAPDAFTPNGDGTNDHFTVFGKYVSDYQIKIYNRWGEEVYSSTDINELNDLSRGWDGTYKGKLQDVGTFVYYITGKDLNGKSIFEKGNVTLIR